MLQKIGFKPCCTNICDNYVTCRIYPQKNGDFVTRVALINNSEETEINATNIQVELLTSDRTSLEKHGINFDYGILPFLIWNNSKQIFKFNQFKTDGVIPAFLSLIIFGEHRFFKLMQDEGEPQNGDGENGETPEEEIPEEETPESGTPPAGSAPPAEAPPQGRCCVESFETPKDEFPNGQVPTDTVELNNPDAGKFRIYLAEGWKVKAKFSSTPEPCNCDCCEYRQYVKGHVNLIFNAGEENEWVLDQNPELDFVIPEGGGDPEPVKLNDENFLEDSVPNHKDPTEPHNYGHKPSQGIMPEAYRDCYYWNVDTPKSRVIPFMDITVDIDIKFQGKIIDICTGEDREVEEWQWKKRDFLPRDN